MKKYDIYTSEMRNLTVGYAKILEFPVNRYGSEYYINTFNMIIDIYWVTAYSNNPTWAKYSIALASASSLRVFQLNERLEGTMIENSLAYVVNSENNTLDVYVKNITQWSCVYVSIDGAQMEPLFNIIQSGDYISPDDFELLNPVYAKIKETIPLVNDSRLDNVRGRNDVCDSIYLDQNNSTSIQLDNWNSQRQYWIQLREILFEEDYVSADIYITREKVLIDLPHDVKSANLVSNDPRMWKVGQYGQMGQYDPSAKKRICYRNLIPVLPGDQIYFHTGNNIGGFAVRGYKEDCSFTQITAIGSVSNGTVLEIPSDTYYISITVYTTDDSMEYEDYVTALNDGTFSIKIGNQSLINKMITTDLNTENGTLTINNLRPYGFLFYRIMRSY